MEYCEKESLQKIVCLIFLKIVKVILKTVVELKILLGFVRSEYFDFVDLHC